LTSIGAAYDSPRNTRVVLIVAFLLVLGFGLWGLISPDVMTAVSVGMVDFVLDSVGWLYLALCSGFVILGGLLAFGRYGRVRLGPDDSRPEFSTASWLAMLFAGGMGAGLVFWGVAEPVSHFAHPPGNVVGSTPEAARLSMMLTNLHWGLHAWSIYAVCALVLAYFMFRRGLPGLISTPIRATLPASRPTRLLGFTSDIVATFAVVFGLAGSLVMGVLQVRAGVTEVFGIAPTTAVSVVILGVLAVAFMLSASTGLSKGIQILSNINMVLVILLRGGGYRLVDVAAFKGDSPALRYPFLRPAKIPRGTYPGQAEPLDTLAAQVVLATRVPPTPDRVGEHGPGIVPGVFTRLPQRLPPDTARRISEALDTVEDVDPVLPMSPGLAPETPPTRPRIAFRPWSALLNGLAVLFLVSMVMLLFRALPKNPALEPNDQPRDTHE